jgi:hypothetical protein
MSENITTLAGYNQEVQIEYRDVLLNLLVKPESDFNNRFKAWCMDGQEFIWVNGWIIEDILYVQPLAPTIKKVDDFSRQGNVATRI